MEAFGYETYRTRTSRALRVFVLEEPAIAAGPPDAWVRPTARLSPHYRVRHARVANTGRPVR
jgi:hypothetical protein